jgi:imidazolonepropionase-like amidohydrolase
MRSNPLRSSQSGSEVATIEPGKRADLVVLNGDPLAHMSNVRKTSLVVTRGRVYDATALWKVARYRR